MHVFQRLQNERGVVIVWVAASMVVILGMAALTVDLGQIYLARQRAQNVCDYAVLAGVPFLTGSADCTSTSGPAYTCATQIAAANNGLFPADLRLCLPSTTTEGLEISFPSGSLTTDSGGSIAVAPGEAIRAQGMAHVRLGFARIFGFSEKDVSAQSTAIIEGARNLGTSLYVPLSASDKTIFGDQSLGIPPIEFGSPTLLHVNDHSAGFLGSGNYLSIRLGGDSGASDYRNRLAGNSRTQIDLSASPPSYVNTEPGLKGNATYEGIKARLAKETDPLFAINNTNAWNNWLNCYDPDTQQFPSTWRIVMVPIIQDTAEAVNGQKPVQVVGMAGFFIDKIYDGKDGIHQKGDLEGYFLQGVATGDTIRWIFPVSGQTSGSTQFIYRARVIS